MHGQSMMMQIVLVPSQVSPPFPRIVTYCDSICIFKKKINLRTRNCKDLGEIRTRSYFPGEDCAVSETFPGETP